MKLTAQETLGGFNGPHTILTDEVDYTAHVYELSGPNRIKQIVRAVNTHERAKAVLSDAALIVENYANAPDFKHRFQTWLERATALLAEMEG